MTKEERTLFDHGVILGFILGLVLMVLCGIFSYLDDPLNVITPNQALNSGEYTIDTMQTIINTDTTTEYKFRKR